MLYVPDAIFTEAFEGAAIVLKVCIPVKVCAASVRAIVAEVVGNVIVVPSVPARVRVFDTDNVFRFVIVSIPVVVVIVSPLTVVAVAAPIFGVVSVGEVARTIEPEPVVVFPRAVRVPDVGKVTFVIPVKTKVEAYAPENVALPPSVRVFDPLLIPVPP